MGGQIQIQEMDNEIHSFHGTNYKVTVHSGLTEGRVKDYSHFHTVLHHGSSKSQPSLE